MYLANKNNSAFTSLETLVYIAVFSMIMGAALWLIFNFYKTQNAINAQIKASSELRKIAQTMMQDLRETSYSDAGAYPIEEMAENSITFYSDVDNDSKIEKVSYFLDGSRLIRQITKSSGVPAVYDPANAQNYILGETIQNAALGTRLFRYFDAQGNEIADLTQVLDLRFVKITLVLDKDLNRAPEPYTLSFHAALRNLINDYVWP